MEPPYHRPSFRGGRCVPGTLNAQGLWTLLSDASMGCKHSSRLSPGKHRARVRQEATLPEVKLFLFCCTGDKSPLEPLLYLALTCELAFVSLLVSVHLNSQQGQGAQSQQGQGARPHVHL